MDDPGMPTAPVVMTMPDEIDVSNAGYVGEQLRSAIIPGGGAVVADLTSTTFCDSFAVLHLMLAHDKAVANSVRLLFVVPAGAVLRLLELVGARRVLRICPTVTAALATAARDMAAASEPDPDLAVDGRGHGLAERPGEIEPAT
jgi:anti-sigma B factor antagonist